MREEDKKLDEQSIRGNLDIIIQDLVQELRRENDLAVGSDVLIRLFREIWGWSFVLVPPGNEEAVRDFVENELREGANREKCVCPNCGDEHGRS